MSFDTRACGCRGFAQQVCDECQPRVHLHDLDPSCVESLVGECVLGRVEQKVNTVPRVAESIEDLRVGQLVIDIDPDDPVRDSVVFLVSDDSLEFGFEDSAWDGGLVILADAPAEPVNVPAEAVERLRDATIRYDHGSGTAREVAVAADELIHAIDGAGE